MPSFTSPFHSKPLQLLLNTKDDILRIFFPPDSESQWAPMRFTTILQNIHICVLQKKERMFWICFSQKTM